MDQKNELQKLREFRELLKTYQSSGIDPEYQPNMEPRNPISTQIEPDQSVGKKKKFQNQTVIPFLPQNFLENKKNGFSNIFMLAFLTLFFEGIFLFVSFILFR